MGWARTEMQIAEDRTGGFRYLLNAMEGAAHAENPSAAGYYEKRMAVLRYVANLTELAYRDVPNRLPLTGKPALSTPNASCVAAPTPERKPYVYPLFMDGDEYRWNAPVISDRDIRMLTGVPDDVAIFLKVPGQPDRPVEAATVIPLDAADVRLSTQMRSSFAGAAPTEETA